jgi:phosphoribosylformylglycinamidine (FGAM) synthase-like amidotransferase family enzyme
MNARRPRVCVVTGYGINADHELALAFEMAGGTAKLVHVRDLIDQPGLFSSYRIIAFPGGFSFGDHLGSGKVFATLFRRTLGEAMTKFIAEGGLAIGICNGFQVLVKSGILPDLSGRRVPEASLIHNESGRFVDRWVRVRFEPGSRCVWTRGIPDMDLPIRHGEGRFVTASDAAMEGLDKRGCISVRYLENPNGSQGDVAGICDPTGRVFGLMPHPEAFIHPEQHPDWPLRPRAEGEGLAIIRAGVHAAT